MIKKNNEATFLPEMPAAIDDYLVSRIIEKIGVLSNYYENSIRESCNKDSHFGERLKHWFHDQGWSFSRQQHDFTKAARQTAYLLVNKLLFYHLLQLKRPKDLDPLEIPGSLSKAELLQHQLKGYFNRVLKLGYEAIYETDFIDEIPIPDVKEVVDEIKQLVHILRSYDFSKPGVDVIGRIFERLLPEGERHLLGQYFTDPDVVDLVLRFSLHQADDIVLDPSCGAGIFLVRAYRHKKLMNNRKKHQELLAGTWGNDIAKFPAHLAAINLAIPDLAVNENYPNILHQDFFAFQVGDEGFDLEKWRQARARTLGRDTREITYPRWFDAIVGNPPYTRQEEISEISPQELEYKEKIIGNALSFHGEKIAEIGKRAGIYTYFFVHGYKFLREGGYFGFIVPNSWLDVDYGKGLKEFFLKNYKITAIIESKVERWFVDADINTCIVILQKCSDEGERAKHLARFVYLKKPLRYFIPPAQDEWQKELDRLHAIEQLIKTILAHNDFYQDEELRIYPKTQAELWDEGYDQENRRYQGSKWGQYLRAPEIFFKILKDHEKLFVRFNQLFKVGWGSVKTGVDSFFYLDEQAIKENKIEPGYISQKVVRSPKDSKTIEIAGDELRTYLLIVDKEKKELTRQKVLSYIKKGERLKYHERPTCASRTPWYDLHSAVSKRANILWPGGFHDRFVIFWNPGRYISDRRLFNLYPVFAHQQLEQAYCALLNSTLYTMFIEIYLKTVFGQGLLLSDTYAVERMPLVDFRVLPGDITTKLQAVFDILKKRIIGSIFAEIGAGSAAEVSLEKIQHDRRELDKIVMGEILGLSEAEQLEVYRAVIDLVGSRIGKAQSVEKKKKIIESIDPDLLKDAIVEDINDYS